MVVGFDWSGILFTDDTWSVWVCGVFDLVDCGSHHFQHSFTPLEKLISSYD